MRLQLQVVLYFDLKAAGFRWTPPSGPAMIRGILPPEWTLHDDARRAPRREG